MQNCKKALDFAKKEKVTLKREDFKKIYLIPVQEFNESDSPQKLMRHRIILRYYLLEYQENQSKLFK